MKERLINNLGLKVLSIFLAFFVWLVVINVSNPEITRTKEVPLDIENGQVLQAANRTYELSGKNTATVTYNVRARDEYRIRATDFRAYIDLAELYDVTGSVPIKIEVLNNRELIQDAAARPGVARVTTEELQRKRFELVFNIPNDPAEDYAINSTTATPEYVYVEGPASAVGLISTVGLEIPLNGNETEDVVDSTVPVFYNANGSIIQNDRVSVSAEEIEYRIGISKIKNLNIDFQVVGTAAAGYQYAGVESSTRTISVVGLRTNLASINMITVPSSLLNVDGATEDRVIQVDLRNYLPEGVELAEGENPVIDIRLRVEPLENRTFRVQASNITMTGAAAAYDYRITPRQIEVIMQGLGEDLSSLNLSDLGIRMDVTGLEPGTHPGTLSFTLNEVFTVLSYTQFEIEVTERADAAETTEADESADGSTAAGSTAASSGTANESSEAGNEPTTAGSSAAVIQPPERTTEAEIIYNETRSND